MNLISVLVITLGCQYCLAALSSQQFVASNKHHRVDNLDQCGNQRSQQRGTFLTLKCPSPAWLAKVFHSRNTKFNHGSPGMTNPSLHCSAPISIEEKTALGMHVPSGGGTNKQLASIIPGKWWPECARESSSWRKLCFRKENVGKGRECYERLRDAALQWEFHNGQNGIFSLNSNGSPVDQKPDQLMVEPSSPRYNPRSAVPASGRRGGDIINMDPFSLQSEQVIPISLSPGGRQLATYRKVRLPFSLPSLTVLNPVAVVYDLMDKRGPQTTYSSTAYGTMKRHWLCGEERVTVALRDGEAEEVDIEIVSFSRPSPSLWGRMIWPMIGPMQRKFFESQMQYLEDVASQK